MNNKETVCAVVVTYNRKNLLIECLDALCYQTNPLDAIYIIDNCSTDGTPQLLLDYQYIDQLPPENHQEPIEMEITPANKPKIFYVRMHENTGGAGGFHEGVKRAYEKGFDWLWLMDDDVEPLPDGLEIQLSYKAISQCIHPSKMYLNGERFHWTGYIDEKSGFIVVNKDNFEKKDWVVVNYGCFEGMLIHKKIIKQIGYPDSKYFIIGDDTEYGYLASQYTNNIYIKNFCFIKKLDKRTQRVSRLATYLFFRNVIGYLAKKYSKNKTCYLLHTLYVLLRSSLGVIKRMEIIKLFDIYTGYFDGLLSNWGKEKRYLKNKEF